MKDCIQEYKAKAEAYDRLMSGGKKTLKEWANIFGTNVAINHNGDGVVSVTPLEFNTLSDGYKIAGYWSVRPGYPYTIFNLPHYFIDYIGDWKDSLTFPDGWEVEKKTVVKEKQKEEKKEMPKFEVGKTYVYNGKIGDPSPFVAIGIEEQDALFIVSGKPLVCRYVENNSGPFIKFEGMSWGGGWALNSRYHLFDEVSKDKYVPAKKFEAGKWYVCHLSERPSTWNAGGKMDGLLDGKPHKCIMGNETDASFEDIPLNGIGGWCFSLTIDYFEEVPAPSSEVDWEKKYAELEKRYHKLKGMFVEYMMDEEVE